MPTEFIGTKRKELSDWLAKTWLVQGRPVCFVHGFPGTGKTSLADVLAENTATKPGGGQNSLAELFAESSSLKYVRHDKVSTSTSVDDLLLELQERASEVGLPDLEDALFKQGLDAPTALMRLMEKPVLIVVHEGQRFLDEKTGQPFPEILSMLTRVARRGGYPGRLLFLTNRLVPKGEKWSEPFEIRRLEGLTVDEATRVLDDLLNEHGRGADIPQAKRRDIVTCLGCNPRALRTLVGCLENSSWEELIKPNPDAWIPKDTEVAPDLVARLEEGLIQHRFGRLEPATMRFVQRLSIHRQAVKIEALNDLAEAKDSTPLRQELSSLLWMDQSAGWYSLHAVVKEVAVSKLKKLPPSELLNAHSRAADYYLRPFQAKQMVGGSGLAGSFAEVRYHLQEAKRGDELGEIAQRYSDYLWRIYPAVSPVPDDPAVLKERIGVLSVLLKEPGAKSLEYYLARLLQARNAPGDLEQAMVHAARSTGASAPADSWLLRVKLEYKVRGLDIAEKTLKKALKKVSAEEGVFKLLLSGAEMYESSGKHDDAIKLLIGGIDRVPPDQGLETLCMACAKLMAENDEIPDAILLLRNTGLRKLKSEHNVFYIYQTCAELMAKDGRIGEAIKLLKEGGIPEVKPEHSVFALYQCCAELMAKDGCIGEAIGKLKEGIQRIPANRFSRFILVDMMCDCCVAANDLASFQWALSEAQKESFGQKQHWQWKITAAGLAKDWKSALSLTHQAKEAFPGYLNFYIHEAYCQLHLAGAEAAFDAIRAFPKRIFEKDRVPNFWLMALICFRRGDAEGSKANLATFLGCPPESCPELTEELFHRLWKTPCGSELYKSPAFFFPFFPPIVSLPTPAQAEVAPSAKQTVLAVATEWHSAHGGVSTFNRELCRAFAKEGYQVWCYVPDARDEVLAQVKEEDGVSLLYAPREAHAHPDARLRNCPDFPAGTAPDIIISHDRITGPAATSLVENHFPNSKHILFIHTAPKQIEWFKEQGDDTTATGTGEVRRQLQISLARKAHLVAGVGPKLQNAMANELHALTPSKTALAFLPGLETPFRDASPPPANECLVLGRAEDADLKGLDIAALAMAKLLATPHQTINPTPVLVVRGAPIGTGDVLRNDLMQRTQLGANHLHIREYSSDVDVIRRDMLSSALVLMPSRTEGFGLAALEAIALGIPVLVSDQSGLADTLNTLVPEHAKKCVVHVSADLETDATAWERKIDFVLSDKSAAFARANELRNALAPHLYWQKAVRSLVEVISSGCV